MGLKVTKKYYDLLEEAQTKGYMAKRINIHHDACCGIATLQSVLTSYLSSQIDQAAFVLGFHNVVTNPESDAVKRNILYYAPPTVLPYTNIVAFLKSLGFRKIGGHTINPRYGTRELGIYLLKQE